MSSFNAKLFQSPQLKQEMRINPRLYQAMELLYMPLLDLQQHLKTEMEENPFLEMEESDIEEDLSVSEEGEEPEAQDDEIDWEEILLEGFDAGGRKAEYEHREYREPTPVQSESLHDYLLEQLFHLEFSDRDRRLGEEIIGNVSHEGPLSCDLEEMVEALNGWVGELYQEGLDRVATLPEDEQDEAADELWETFHPYRLEEAEAVLERIQNFDPPGVAARSLKESIQIQLRRSDTEDPLPHRIVEEFFDDLINHRWTDIAKEIGRSPQEVQAAADAIAKLDPKPGLKYSGEPERYVVPDLVAEKIDGEYMVFANDTNLPRLRLSSVYRDIARDREKFTGENKEFIASKLNSANWMIQAVEQRRQTMLKVMNYIVDRQRDFFERGVQHLRPLTLREVAEHIDMHESTVSRVTNEKFVQTPRGVYPLKFFFSSGLSTTTGQDISARGVKAKIKNLVGDENEKKPLTDQAIVDLLRQDGVQIARRTVAKYRDQLGILPARMRKRV